MKGLAYIGNQSVGWVEKPIPHAKGFEAVIRLIAVAPCSSDVHNVEENLVQVGRIVGHEGVGEIVEIGSDVQDFKVGDRVIIPAITPDWRAPEVQLGFHQHSRGLTRGAIISNTADGVFAEYVLINDADCNLALLPEEVSPEEGVMLTDMVSTGMYGAELAEVGFGDTVVVLGIGPVGLMCVAAARMRGAGRIIAVGTRPKCVEAALYYGATDIVSYKDGDVAKQIYKMTNKKGADRCIVAGGGLDILNTAVAVVRPGGNIGNVNYFAEKGDITFSNYMWGMGIGNKTIRGGHCPGGRVRMEHMANLVKYGRLDTTKLITHRFQGLDSIEEAFLLMMKKPSDLIKPVVLL